MAGEKPKTGRPLDATGETVRRNIRWIRDARRLTGAELSERLDRLGRPIPLLGIQRIEAGTRRVDVDDLAAIAAALGVSPASLLMNLRNDADEESAVPKPGDEVLADDPVSITGWRVPIPARWVWGWLTASNPLQHGAVTSFVELGWPAWERDRWNEEQRRQMLDSSHRKGPEVAVPDEVVDQLVAEERGRLGIDEAPEAGDGDD